MPKKVSCIRDRIVTVLGDNSIEFELFGDWDLVAIEMKYSQLFPKIGSVWVEPDTEAPVLNSISAIGIKGGYICNSSNFTWNGRIPIEGNALLRGLVNGEAGHDLTLSCMLERR